MSLFAEFKRRSVFRVGLAYAIVSWVLAQIAGLALPTLLVPDWVLRAFILLLLLGFPIALVLAWAYELTPEGVRRTADTDRESPARQGSRTQPLAYAVIAVLFVSVVYLVWLQEPAPVAAENTRTIAVLPFVNQSDDSAQEFFSDGISEELINLLAKLQGLRVSSRTSAFSFKGTSTPIPEIAEVLGVQYVLEGTVSRSADELRISARLIDVPTDSLLWTDTYTRQMSDIFRIQEEIAGHVNDALELTLLGVAAEPLAPLRQTAPDIYEDYLEARQLFRDPTFAKMEQAVDLLESVIERDPEYAPAYGALSYAYWRRTSQGSMTINEAYEHMSRLAPRALELDDTLAEAWNAQATVEWVDRHAAVENLARMRAQELGMTNEFVVAEVIYRYLYTRNPEPAEALVEQLLRVDPLGPESLRRASQYYGRIGEPERGRAILERLHQIDPESARWHWELHNGGHLDDDLAELADILIDVQSVDPLDPEGPGFLAHLYLELGDTDSALAWSERALDLGREHPFALMVQLYLAMLAGDDAATSRAGEQLLTDDVPGRMGSRVLALAALTNRDLAAGRGNEAIARYLQIYPELARNRIPTYSPADTWPHVTTALYAALDLARVYRSNGEPGKADQLLDAVENELPFWPETGGNFTIGFAAAELYALRGQRTEALRALRSAMDADTWIYWRWRLLLNQNFDSLRDDPDFQAIVAGQEQRMARELERIRAN